MLPLTRYLRVRAAYVASIAFCSAKKIYENYAFLALEKTAETHSIVCISGSLWLFVSL